MEVFAICAMSAATFAMSIYLLHRKQKICGVIGILLGIFLFHMIFF